jgi:hypothetical protein
MDQRTRPAVLVVIAALLLTSACATMAERETCTKLVTATKIAIEEGSAPIDAETAKFARAKGLQANIAPDPSGTGEILVPKSLPFPLVAAVNPKDGGPQYQRNVRSLTPEYLKMIGDEGRRCEW